MFQIDTEMTDRYFSQLEDVLPLLGANLVLVRNFGLQIPSYEQHTLGDRYYIRRV